MSDTTMDGFDRCSCDESQALRAEVERLTKELAVERADKGLIRAYLTARAEGAEARAEQDWRLRVSIVAERDEIEAEGRRMERLVDGMKDLIDRFENPLSKPETVPFTAAEAWESTVARLRRELEEAKADLAEVVSAKQSTDEAVCEACDVLRGVSPIDGTLVELARSVRQELHIRRMECRGYIAKISSLKAPLVEDGGNE